MNPPPSRGCAGPKFTSLRRSEMFPAHPGTRVHQVPGIFSALSATVIATAAFGICSPAYAVYEIARGALFVDASLRQEYDSNIYGNSFEISDRRTVFTPGLSFVRDAGLLRADAAAGLVVQRFWDFQLENSEDPFFKSELSWKKDENKTDALLALSARRNTGADPDANTRTQSDEYSARGSVGLFSSEKVGYRLLAAWNNRDYHTAGLSSIREASLGAEGRYQYSSKLETFLSLGGRQTETYGQSAGQLPTDSRDWKAAVGVTGELLPKVTGRAAIGWVERSFDVKAWPKQSGVLLESALNWLVNEETTLGILAKRDFDTSPTDQSIERLEFRLDARRTLREKIVLTGGFSYVESDYLGDVVPRKDIAYIGHLGAEYTFTKSFNLKLDANYRFNESDRAISQFERYVMGITLERKF